MGHWDYSESKYPFPYGECATTYEKAMPFLDDCETVEDWGCGLTYAKQFRHGKKYIGIDGSWSKFADVIADLREYRSSVDGILIRHVLEHNFGWKNILENAIASFTKKLVIVTFTPFSDHTHQIATNFADTPDISFKKDDITQHFSGLKFSEEACQTPFLPEHLFYVEK